MWREAEGASRRARVRGLRGAALLRSLQMVITTVYKLIRSFAGKGTGNERRGVISADLSAGSRAARSFSVAVIRKD